MILRIQNRIQQILDELRKMDVFITRYAEDHIGVDNIDRLQPPLSSYWRYKINLRLELQSLNRQLRMV